MTTTFCPEGVSGTPVTCRLGFYIDPKTKYHCYNKISPVNGTCNHPVCENTLKGFPFATKEAAAIAVILNGIYFDLYYGWASEYNLTHQGQNPSPAEYVAALQVMLQLNMYILRRWKVSDPQLFLSTVTSLIQADPSTYDSAWIPYFAQAYSIAATCKTADDHSSAIQNLRETGANNSMWLKMLLSALVGAILAYMFLRRR